jgi:hypothetical protein
VIAAPMSEPTKTAEAEKHMAQVRGFEDGTNTIGNAGAKNDMKSLA